MVALAEFVLDSGAVPLWTLFERFPEATVELERVVPCGGRDVPYFWIVGGGGLDLERGFDPGGDIERLTLVDELDGRSLVRIDWKPDHNGLTEAIAASDVTLLSAVGTVDGWRLEVRGDDRAAVSRFHEMCREYGIALELATLHRLTPTRAAELSSESLTEPQWEALTLAYERGYYDSPRTTSLEELATALGISRQAVSMRLKRGTRALIEGSVSDVERDGD